MTIERGSEFGQAKQQELDRIKERAEKSDVTYELNRWFGGRMRQEDPELLEIQKHGLTSEAVSWLKSTTPEGMEYGKASKEERFERAREYAERAQTTIEELAEQQGIKLPGHDEA